MLLLLLVTKIRSGAIQTDSLGFSLTATLAAVNYDRVSVADLPKDALTPEEQRHHASISLPSQEDERSAVVAAEGYELVDCIDVVATRARDQIGRNDE